MRLSACSLRDAAHLVLRLSLRLTLVWSEGGQREARETMELLKALPTDVYHVLVLAFTD